MDRGWSDLRSHSPEYRRWVLSRIRRGKDNGVTTLAVVADRNCLERRTNVFGTVAGDRAR